MGESTRGSSVDRDVQHGERWTFNDAVTDAFEDMLQRSIPQYEVMRASVFSLGSLYVQKNSDVVDLGCSRGEALQPFVHRFGCMNRFFGVEVSQPMLDASKKRYEALIERGVVDIRKCDLRTEYPPVVASLTLAILTIQFTPIEYRQQIMKKIYDHTQQGGAVIIVEKVIGSSAKLDADLVGLYLDKKKANGYTQDEIDRKKLSLEGVLVPVTAKWNEELLSAAGFRDIECFWRWMNFAGWIGVKS